MHGEALVGLVLPANGFNLSIGNAVSLIGLELAAIALLASLEPALRGMSGGMIVLGAAATLLMGPSGDAAAGVELAWQVRAHVLVALASYGLLSVGTIVAIFALIQENRLQAARISAVSQLFAPLETTEKLLFAVATAGFIGLTLTIVSGSTFVNDLLQQHLAHKFALSVLAWLASSWFLSSHSASKSSARDNTAASMLILCRNPASVGVFYVCKGSFCFKPIKTQRYMKK